MLIKIKNTFGKALGRETAFHKNGVPILPLEVSLKAITCSSSLVFSLLLSQSVLFFNYENDNLHSKKGVILNLFSVPFSEPFLVRAGKSRT